MDKMLNLYIIFIYAHRTNTFDISTIFATNISEMKFYQMSNDVLKTSNGFSVITKIKATILSTKGKHVLKFMDKQINRSGIYMKNKDK